MTAKFTPKMRSFAASSLLDAVDMGATAPPKWESGTSYPRGNLVFNGTELFVKISETTSNAADPPVNGLEWQYIGDVNQLEVFKKNLYLFISQLDTADWDVPLDPDETHTNETATKDALRRAMSFLKITRNGIATGLRKYVWESGQVYSAYDPNRDPLMPWVVDDPNSGYEHPFYVINSDDRIYKCIDNNQGQPSTEMPSGTALEQEQKTVDKYVWKYMGNVSDPSKATSAYVPVVYKRVNDASAQWNVQANAKPLGISKVINLKKTSPCELTNTTSTVTVVYVGDATITDVAETTVDDDAGEFRQVIITDPGSGYDDDVYFVSSESTAAGSGGAVSLTLDVDDQLTASIGAAGSGYDDGAICLVVDKNNPDFSLTVTLTVTNGEITNIGQGSLPTTGFDFDSVRAFVIPGTKGAVGIGVPTPKEGHGFNIITELAANALILFCRIPTGSDYFETGDTHKFHQIGVVTDLYETMTPSPVPAVGNYYIGPKHSEWGDNTKEQIDTTYGHVLYMNNIIAFQRQDGQEEELRVVIPF